MRRIRYRVAMSLDGYIAGPNGEYDWIVAEPEVNFAQIWAQFDTFLIGRRTYEPMVARFGKKAGLQGKKAYVFSRTLQQKDHPCVTILSELTRDEIKTIREQSGNDIWLFGGGELFRSMLKLGEVDTVEVSIIPVLLGRGLQLLPPLEQQTTLKLSGHKVYRSGRVFLTYDVQR